MHTTEKIILQIEKEAKKYFKEPDACHDWTHVERVRKLALRMGKKERADLMVIEIAALLHDICKKEEMLCKGKFCHAEIGGEKAQEIISKFKLDKETENNIIHCIKSHRYRNDRKPSTIEAKILYDADKLDSIGAIGIARDFLFAGFAGSKTLYTGREKEIAGSKKNFYYTKEDSAILEFEVKLKFIKNKMLTSEGKRMANERHRYMLEYFKRFWEEAEGKK